MYTETRILILAYVFDFGVDVFLLRFPHCFVVTQDLPW